MAKKTAAPKTTAPAAETKAKKAKTARPAVNAKVAYDARNQIIGAVEMLQIAGLSKMAETIKRMCVRLEAISEAEAKRAETKTTKLTEKFLKLAEEAAKSGLDVRDLVTQIRVGEGSK